MDYRVSHPEAERPGRDRAPLDDLPEGIHPQLTAKLSELDALSVFSTPFQELTPLITYYVDIDGTRTSRSKRRFSFSSLSFLGGRPARRWEMVMSVVAALVFALAGIVALALASQALCSTMPAIKRLYRQVSLPECGTEIVVTLREPVPVAPFSVAPRHRRQHRHPVPKPVTHRLHQFGRPRTAA